MISLKAKEIVSLSSNTCYFDNSKRRIVRSNINLNLEGIKNITLNPIDRSESIQRSESMQHVCMLEIYETKLHIEIGCISIYVSEDNYEITEIYNNLVCKSEFIDNTNMILDLLSSYDMIVTSSAETLVKYFPAVVGRIFDLKRISNFKTVDYTQLSNMIVIHQLLEKYLWFNKLNIPMENFSYIQILMSNTLLICFFNWVMMNNSFPYEKKPIHHTKNIKESYHTHYSLDLLVREEYSLEESLLKLID